MYTTNSSPNSVVETFKWLYPSPLKNFLSATGNATAHKDHSEQENIIRGLISAGIVLKHGSNGHEN